MPADELITRELEAIDAALAGEPVAADQGELAALAVALRDERPQPRPAFTRELDARAAAGFPRRRPRRWRLSLPVLLPSAAVAAVAVIVVAVALVGHGSPGSPPAERATSAGSSSAGADAAGGASSSASLAAPRPTTAPATGSPRSDGRHRRFVERSAALTLAAPPRELATAADRIVAVADRLGGFVQSSTVTEGGYDAGGEFVLRVPGARLDDAMAQLSRIAHVRARQQTAVDITRAHVSAADRLAEHRSERAGLLRRLSTSLTDAQIAAVKARLRTVDRQIAAARTALARVDNRARYATVEVTLVADRTAAAPAGSRWTPADAARDAVRVLEVAAGVLLVGLAGAAPLALLAVLALTAIRLRARRGRERALDLV